MGTFIRLGWRERAHALLAYFMGDRRPAAWNQWAEVVGRDPRKSRFVGDMPHGWIASDFIRATLDLFAYERDDRSLVLAAGVLPDWLAGGGIAIKNLRTPYGRLSYWLQKNGERVRLHVASGVQLPPGGIAFVWPGRERPGPTRVNGKTAVWRGNELRIAQLPADVTVDLQKPPTRNAMPR